MLEYWYIGRGLFTFHETLVYRNVCHLRIHLLCLMLAKQPICQSTQVSFKSRLIIFTIWHLTIRFPVWLLVSQSARNKRIHQVSVVDLRCWPAALHYCLAPESNFFRRTCNSEKSLSVMFFYCRKLLIPRVHSLPRQGPWCFSIGPEQTWTNCCASGTSPLICVPMCYVQLSFCGCFDGLPSLLLLLLFMLCTASYFTIPKAVIQLMDLLKCWFE